ncbi:DUF3098 domain-containing protein [uncultured Rikenella sp.]|uniref:DUF3098 domain-containing protein n=1 Tax=uncultured Rikenella sp. TaxID=368003 RepID=UPI00260B7DBE|nr:DUF3098 domain-containing protein [uncultured Rikenella sp.]
MKKQTPASEMRNSAMALDRRNYVMILCGIAAIILGFILLSGGGSEDPATQFNDRMFSFRRLYVAPVLLLAGFLFEIFAIMYRPKTSETGENAATDTKTE